MPTRAQEASRLVFVYVKDCETQEVNTQRCVEALKALPRSNASTDRVCRKVAVPVPEGYAWQEFLQQVKGKLRITGVKEIYMASSGQKVTSLDELQDIDELCVVEGAEPVATNAAPSQASLRAGSVSSTSEIISPNGKLIGRQQSMKPVVVVGVDQGQPGHSDDEGKYRGRVNPLRRALQKILPSLFSPSLPVTTRDVADNASEASGSRVARRRRGKRSILHLRNVLLILAVISCIATMCWFVFASPKLAT